MTATTNTNTIRFTLKDAGRESLARTVGGILAQDTIYSEPSSLTRAAGGYVVNCSTRPRTMKGMLVMNIRFSISAAGRRAFADAVGEILGETVAYNGVPTFAYSVGRYTVARDGALIFPNNIFHRESIDLIMALRERGYEVETNDLPDFYEQQMAEHGETTLNCDDTPSNEQHHQAPSIAPGDRLVIEMPRTHISLAAIESIKKIVASKETLFKKALGADSLPIDITEDKICFPWFTLTGEDGEADAYARFVNAICEMAKRQRRITAREREIDNDKFAMRTFLIRLGFVGAEYKTARKILLRNLTGDSAWKGGKPPVRPEEVILHDS